MIFSNWKKATGNSTMKHSLRFFKLQKHPSKKSEASNPLIISIDFWLFRLIFSIQKNQDPRRKEIVYRRKTWRRIWKSCWSVDWFFFKFCPFREGDLFFREGVFHTTPLSNSWLFQKLLFSPKSQELVLWIKQLGYSDFLKDTFAAWFKICPNRQIPYFHSLLCRLK